MKNIVVSAFSVVLLSGCLSIKQGRYYAVNGPGFPSTSNLFFYRDGRFESYFLSEGSRRLMEKGSWESHRDSAIVDIDSTFDYLGKGTRSNIKISFKRKSRKVLFITKNLGGQTYTSEWVHTQ